ncbi:glycosyltransferase family 4 protein [Planktomarina sp.]|nr:glycosyltransferase family 4 protein [Planktomarina sp.]MDA9100791.1 glycosyltransferase family 4 protein [Planktomarina sp.]
MTKVIFIFRQYAGIPPSPGGYQHFSLAKCMVNDGYNVYLYVSNFNHVTKTYDKKFTECFLIEEIQGVNVVWVNNRPSYKNNGFRRLVGMIDYSVKAYLAARSISKGDHRASMIVGSVAHSFAVLSAWYFSWKRKIPLWIDISELWPEAYLQSGVISKSHPLTYMLGGLANFLYKKGDFVTVINSNTKDFIVSNRGVSEGRVHVFVPGFECEESPLCEPRAVLKEDTPFRVIYTGGLGDLYPLEELIKAVSNLIKNQYNIEVQIVGDGPRKNSFISLVQEFGITDSVKFFQAEKKANLWAMYADSDVLLVIEKNVKYGFPSKLLDYFNAARPVLMASDADYPLPDELFIKCSPTAVEIEKALKKLMALDDETIGKIGSDTFIFAKENYGTSSQYMSLISPKLKSLDLKN